MVCPLTQEADRLTRRLAIVVAAGLTGVLLAPTFPIALVAYTLTGAANAYFYASTPSQHVASTHPTTPETRYSSGPAP